MDVLDLVRYNHHLWKRFAAYYADHCSWDELSRNLESSHHSVANVTMHAVNMEDWWLHYVLQGKEWDGPAWDGFKDALSMRDRVQQVIEKTEAYLSGLEGDDLTRERTVEVGDDARVVSLEQVLVEVVNENAHHRGEVMAMLWSMDKEPPYVDYMQWVKERPARPGAGVTAPAQGRRAR